MATYKLEVKKEFGQLQHRLYPTGDRVPDWSEPKKELKELLEELEQLLDGIKFKSGGDDTVIFRQTGYSDKRALREAVRTGTY